MKTVKQCRYEPECSIACVSMITGLSMEELVSLYPKTNIHGLEYWTCETARTALIQQGWNPGIYAWTSSFVNCEDPPEVVCNFKNHNGLLIVRSLNSKFLHSVVFDKEIQAIRDPHPDLPEITKLSDYEIVEWVPLVKCEKENPLIVKEFVENFLKYKESNCRDSTVVQI